jgi:23S rRNA G2069 N7-methylase RlmK/C1962 C5-methylase RlmI
MAAGLATIMFALHAPHTPRLLSSSVRTASRAPAIALSSLTSSAVAGTVCLKGGKARLFKVSGHPIVYGGAVDNVKGSVQAGDVVDVVDVSGDLIGWGVYNPHSMYRVRLLATNEPTLLAHRDVGALLRERLLQASDLRRACGLPSESTSAYRLVNSEGDRLSGLTVDVFGETAVAVASALWLEQRREDVLAALSELPGVSEVVWRRSDGRLQQDGWEPPPKAPKPTEAEAEAPPALALSPEERAAAAAARRAEAEVEVTESGLKFVVAPALGQKSGFYCDQRDNRRWLAEACQGKRVLDLFCYSGGFAISAARGGAASCVGVDSSAFALELAARNAHLNGLDATCSFVQADVHKYLKPHAYASPPKRDGEGGGGAPPPMVDAGAYDVVICDPPKLAPSVKDLPRATRKYRQLNSGAMRAIAPSGGLLLTFTCSAAMTQSGGFLRMLQEAAQAEGRSLTVLRVSGAAPDHVVNPGCPETEYLTGIAAWVR